jgi:hypothetical protein
LSPILTVTYHISSSTLYILSGHPRTLQEYFFIVGSVGKYILFKIINAWFHIWKATPTPWSSWGLNFLICKISILFCGRNWLDAYQTHLLYVSIEGDCISQAPLKLGCGIWLGYKQCNMSRNNVCYIQAWPWNNWFDSASIALFLSLLANRRQRI